MLLTKHVALFYIIMKAAVDAVYFSEAIWLLYLFLEPSLTEKKGGIAL